MVLVVAGVHPQIHIVFHGHLRKICALGLEVLDMLHLNAAVVLEGNAWKRLLHIDVEAGTV